MGKSKDLPTNFLFCLNIRPLDIPCCLARNLLSRNECGRIVAYITEGQIKELAVDFWLVKL